MTEDFELISPGKIRPPLDILDEACERYPDAPLFALFSGGHDSLIETHLTAQHPRFTAVVHVNTGIGIEETREFVRKTCKSYGWPLIEYKATELPTPQFYEEFVLRHGFPGPAQHSRMYQRLKERCLAALKKDRAHRRPIILSTGIRKAESVKRMGYAREIDIRAQWIWTAPIVDWLDKDCEKHLLTNSLPRNPVKDALCISGECLCGAYAKKGERAEIRALFPEVDARLTTLEKAARLCSAPCTKWGSGGPPKTYKLEQRGQRFMPLCVGCGED